jgi:hypothetical protein
MIHHAGLFQKYRNDRNVFVETGTYYGLGVQLAINAGYRHVSSVELSPALFKNAVDMYKNEPRVRIYHGTSESQLWDMIKDVNEEIVFWLDAHRADGIMGPEASPILKELAIIKRHPIKTHVIVIDDVRDMGTEHFGMVTQQQVIESAMSINPEYSIVYEDGSINEHQIFKNDILVFYKTRQFSQTNS